MTAESIGIQRVAALHVFVRDLERSRDFYTNQLDFAELAVSSPDFEVTHRARASVVQAGGARLVFMEPLGSRGESYRWLEGHPEGIGRVVFDVADAERAFRVLMSRGATSMSGILRREVDGGHVAWFDIATPIGETTFRFVSHEGRTPIMPDLVRLEPERGGTNRFGFAEVDHITSNFLTLGPAIRWMEEVLGFERYWDVQFHTQDVSKGHFGGSGLKSVVMRCPESGVTFANNEPTPPNYEGSQIFLFCQDHRGAGIQHVAIATGNLVETVKGVRARGAQVMVTPNTYYDMLSEHLCRIGVNGIQEDIERLRELGILVDGKHEGKYLMQIFLADAATQFKDRRAGPFFLELIQRKGDLGFGAGNFRALFESIERQQQNEGRA